MYHQIRLIMGLAFLCIHANLEPQDSISSILNGTTVPGKNFSKIPLAPAEPLLLRELNYRQDGETPLADFLAGSRGERETFLQEKVLPHVFEKSPRPIAGFVASLHQTGGYAWNVLNNRV